MLIDALYAGHSSAIADYATGQRLVETLPGDGLDRVLITDWKSASDQVKKSDSDKYLAELNVVVDDLGEAVNLVGLCQGGWMSDLVLALAPNLWVVMLGIALWGFHMGMTQGLLATLVADTAPAALRGTAFSFFHLVTGIALLAASLLAGVLWDWIGPSATFFGGAVFTATGLAGIFIAGYRRQSTGRNP